MRISISLFLACATVALAVPFRAPSHDAELQGQINKIVRSTLDLQVSTRQSGLNLVACRDDSTCAGDRLCTTLEDGVRRACDAGSAVCTCLPLNPLALFCTSPDDCDQGETCVSVRAFDVCIADAVAQVITSDGADNPLNFLPGVADDSDDDDSDDDDDDAVDVPLIGDIGDLVPASSGKGLTGDACSSDTECTAPRTCTDSPRGGFCIPDAADDCSSNADCVDGEICAAIELGIICISEAVVQANLPKTQAPPTTASVDSTLPVTTAATTTGAVSVSENPTTPETTTDGDSPAVNPISGDRDDEKPSATEDSAIVESESDVSNESVNQLGLTLDPCQDADGCAGGRDCISTDDGDSCRGRNDCRCFRLTSPPVCENDSDCDDGEGCFDAGDLVEDFTNIPFVPNELIEIKLCASRAARDEAVCIASHSLGHISREELVFEKDAVAHVLCDINESCATPGHMVQYRGEGMMMKSYCELTSCVRKVMKVNSPKYRRGLTVPSHTDDLVFTALAARFQSRAEEGVLSAAVRIGF